MLMASNPRLVADMVKVRDQTQKWILGGCGLKTKTIKGEPYVALTRGLNTQVMSDEHALASFSDKEHSGFGEIQHHVWMPVKDIWYTFMAGSKDSRGTFGHENEILGSNHGTRYKAEAKDVSGSIFPNFPPELYDPKIVDKWVPATLRDATPEDVHGAITNPEVATYLLQYFRTHSHKMDAHVAKIILYVTGDPKNILASEIVPGPEAAKWLSDDLVGKPLDTTRIAALRNPNLTTADLVKVAGSNWLAYNSHQTTVSALLNHANANEDVGKALLASAIRRNDPIFFGMTASQLMAQKHPPKQLGDILRSTSGADLDHQRNGPWYATKAYRGDKLNDVVNTDLSDSLISASIAHWGKPVTELVAHYPLSDTALNDILEKKYWGPGFLATLLKQNPFLTPRQIEIIANDPEASYSLRDLAFDHHANVKPEIAKLAREALFRRAPHQVLHQVVDLLNHWTAIEEADPFTDSELAKIGQMARQDSLVYSNALAPLIDRIPVTRLEAWKNILEKPEDLDKLIKAIKESRPLHDVGVTPSDRFFATALARRLVQVSHGEDDPHKHIIVPLREE
jgi:hypothetical protein